MNNLDHARTLLQGFGFPSAQYNAMACRTLLALAELDLTQPWSDATNNRHGVRAMMDWMRQRLGYPIAENSRETVRRQVLHQFVEAGFCHYNDDDPARPTNSSKNNYRLTDEALTVLRGHGTATYAKGLADYKVLAPGLASKYQAARDLHRIPVTLPDGSEVTLKAGGQNDLIKSMIEDFCGFFAPGGKVLYVGDADAKLMIFEEQALARLGVVVDTHGKLPDLVVHLEDKNWLFLMEAASSHGPVDAKRYGELKELFKDSTAGLVYVSCFPDRTTMRRFLADLAWEAEVWVADEPTHMMHFNGARFLGPYTD